MRKTTSRRVFRCAAGTAVAGLVLATTSACTVPNDAVAGLSVTEDGHFLGVMLVCGHHIDAATLYVPRDYPDEDVIAGAWTAREPLQPGLVTWRLDAPAAGWTVDAPLATLDAATTYSFFGGTKDDSSSARQVSFTPADRGRLAPGKVLYDDDGDTSMAVVPMEEFKAGACATL